MELPLAIHKDPNSVYGVTIPDVPGCYSFGDSIDEAIKNAREAVYSHFEAMVEQGDALEVKASKIEDLTKEEDFVGAIWALVDIDLSKIDAKPERINISLPRFVLKKIDNFTESRHETRSGFISRAALAVIAEEMETA
ncbi:type II toxin-antitoxin system HicB family antitoxin [Massilia sp. Bi118]|uniref:type II toxin-antitoxin system HicB family antitoxin n=1 Tax=Massilia sp. Bi118 TaxID=2822346 RepID=UPI001E552E50|nr:type II toxin-antitoxin system HicB family antitoxin [Massilia sp. Bi118]